MDAATSLMGPWSPQAVEAGRKNVYPVPEGPQTTRLGPPADPFQGAQGPALRAAGTCRANRHGGAAVGCQRWGVPVPGRAAGNGTWRNSGTTGLRSWTLNAPPPAERTKSASHLAEQIERAPEFCAGNSQPSAKCSWAHAPVQRGTGCLLLRPQEAGRMVRENAQAEYSKLLG